MKKTVSLLLVLTVLLGTFCGFAGAVYAEEATEALPPMLTYSSAVTDPATYAPQGTGTSEDPYLIATADDLLWVARQHAFTDAESIITDHNAADAKAANINPFQGKYLLQTADIDLGGKVLPSIGLFNNSYDQILTSKPGTVYSVFGGTYDGGNHSISNGYTARINPLRTELKLEAMITPRGGQGLFGIIDGATIKNVHLKNFKLCTDNSKYVSCAGLLVGIALDSAVGTSEYNLIENCSTDEQCAISYTGNGRTSHDAQLMAHMGGLIGSAARTTIRNCVNNATITVGHSHPRVGGIVGSYVGGTIENCVNNGDINIVNADKRTDMQLSNGNNYRMFGGIVGGLPYTNMAAYNTLIDHCVNTGNITLDKPSVNAFAIGGIVGGNRKTQSIRLTISNCANFGIFTASVAEGDVAVGSTQDERIPVACLEGAIVGAVAVQSVDLVAYPQVMEVRLINNYSIPLTLLNTEQKMPAFEKQEILVVPMTNDENTRACTWINLGSEKDGKYTDADGNEYTITDNYKKVVENCLTMENCKIETAENIQKAIAALDGAATPYRIQSPNEDSDKNQMVRVIATVSMTDAKKICAEWVNIKDNTVAAKAETVYLYDSYVTTVSVKDADGNATTEKVTVKAPEGSYFVVIEMDTSSFGDGKFELRLTTVDADGNVIYRPSIQSFEFKRGNLK